MANLRSIRKRIVSVKNTRQITKAMKLVSGAKLKRATDAVVAARPYNRKLKAILVNLLKRMDNVSSPLFQTRPEVKRVVVLAFGSDRGLCGSFNSTITRQLDLVLQQHSDHQVDLIPVGRKVRDYARRRGYRVQQELTNIPAAEFATVSRELVVGLTRAYEEGQVDQVILIYNRFKSAISQSIEVETLLPITAPAAEEAEESGGVDYLYEPSKASILDALLPQLVTAQVMQAFLESTASEHGARMTAMDNATRNASDMIERLTLVYNRARQAAITKELVEIVSGAEAL